MKISEKLSMARSDWEKSQKRQFIKICIIVGAVQILTALFSLLFLR